jgi:hypothetical protein
MATPLRTEPTLVVPIGDRRTRAASRKAKLFTIFEDETATVDNITAIQDAQNAAAERTQRVRLWLMYMTQRCEVVYGLQVCAWSLSLAPTINALEGNDLLVKQFEGWRETMEKRLKIYDDDNWRDPAIWENNMLMEDLALISLHEIVGRFIKMARTRFPGTWRSMLVSFGTPDALAIRFMLVYVAGEIPHLDGRSREHHKDKRDAWRAIMAAHLDINEDDG